MASPLQTSPWPFEFFLKYTIRVLVLRVPLPSFNFWFPLRWCSSYFYIPMILNNVHVSNIFSNIKKIWLLIWRALKCLSNDSFHKSYLFEYYEMNNFRVHCESSIASSAMSYTITLPVSSCRHIQMYHLPSYTHPLKMWKTILLSKVMN